MATTRDHFRKHYKSSRPPTTTGAGSHGMQPCQLSQVFGLKPFSQVTPQLGQGNKFSTLKNAAVNRPRRPPLVSLWLAAGTSGGGQPAKPRQRGGKQGEGSAGPATPLGVTPCVPRRRKMLTPTLSPSILDDGESIRDPHGRWGGLRVRCGGLRGRKYPTPGQVVTPAWASLPP